MQPNESYILGINRSGAELNKWDLVFVSGCEEDKTGSHIPTFDICRKGDTPDTTAAEKIKDGQLGQFNYTVQKNKKSHIHIDHAIGPDKTVKALVTTDENGEIMKVERVEE